jgi:putative exporter of polyketide antibiotics
VDNAVTSANTDTAVFSLVYNNANGGSDTTIATINTATTAGGGSGNITAQIPVALTVTAANAVVPAGSLLAFKITKEGSGKASGSMGITVKAKPV